MYLFRMKIIGNGLRLEKECFHDETTLRQKLKENGIYSIDMTDYGCHVKKTILRKFFIRTASKVLQLTENGDNR